MLSRNKFDNFLPKECGQKKRTLLIFNNITHAYKYAKVSILANIGIIITKQY